MRKFRVDLMNSFHYPHFKGGVPKVTLPCHPGSAIALSGIQYLKGMDPRFQLSAGMTGFRNTTLI